jgi:V/A-type H+-transporting ATPase subunit D
MPVSGDRAENCLVEQLSATRTELIARRQQIGLATQGRDLLKEKRAALVVEFGRLSSGVLETIETLGTTPLPRVSSGVGS